MALVRTAILCLLVVTNSVLVSGEQAKDTDNYISSFLADLWLESADIVKILWRDCSKKSIDVKVAIDHKEYYPKFIKCVKKKTLRALDRSLKFDVVPIVEGVNFVRYDLVDPAGNIFSENSNSTWTEQELEEGEWRTLALQRMAKVLHTHVIKFDFDNEQLLEKVEFRGRRRHHMMTMMMFGIVSIGMVLIPMGFQFLAVLGGKALLLAKMALILASIQGLRKVDNISGGFHERDKIGSGPLNYGFYHTYPYDHYEKRSNDNNWLQLRVPTRTNLYDQWSRNIEKSKIDNFNDRNINDMNRNIDNEPSSEQSNSLFSSMDTSAKTDLTTRTGEVEAEYTLELPYNGLHFQSPATIVPA